MNRASRRDPRARHASALTQPLDEQHPDFAAACDAIVKGSARVARARPEVARAEGIPTVPASEVEVNQPLAERSDPAETAAAQALVLKLEAEIQTLREELTRSQARIEQDSQALSEREARLEQGSAAERTLEDVARRESEAQREIQTLQRTLSAMSADRDADSYDLTQARHREAGIRKEAQALRQELQEVTTHYLETTTALESTTRHLSQSRDELRVANIAISELETTVEQLRLIVAQGDREIEQLRQSLLESEEGRAADAIAIMESLGK